jgi:hypothetical protein
VDRSLDAPRPRSDLTGASAAVRAALIEVAGTIAGRER